MAFKDRVCCICNEHKKFLGRINAGQKLYCMQCQTKITKEYGMDYWKPCSFQEFMEAFSYSIHKGKRKPTNMFSSMKEIIRKYEEQEAKIKAAFLQFDEQEVKNMEKK